MSLLTTRLQIRDRVRLEAQREANTGAYSDPKLNAAIQIATDQVWYALTRADEGYGEVTLSFSVVSGVPGPGETAEGDTMDLPANFLDLRALARINSQTIDVPEFYSRRQYDRLQLELVNVSALVGRSLYLIEGPAYDAAGAEIPQRFRFVPPLAAGEVVRLGYVTRGPVWTDDVQTFDMVAEVVLAALVSYARLIATTRDDNTDYSKAREQLAGSVQAFLADRKRRNHLGVDTPNRYRGHRGWLGY